MTRRPKIELSESAYELWARNENQRQNACGVFTNIPQFKFAPRKLKAKILKNIKKQDEINIAHNKKLPPMGIDMMTIKLVPYTKEGAK